MANDNIAADCQRPAARIKVAGMRDVQNRIVLNVGARSNADAMDVATNHGAWPNRAIIAEMHVANHCGGAVDENALT